MISYFIILLLLIVLFHAFCALFNLKSSKKIMVISCLAVIVLLMVLGYNTKPHLADDLSRYYDEISIFAKNSFKFALKNGTWKDTIISNILLFFCAKLNIKELIPMIGASIIPIVSYFILFNSSEKQDTYRFVFFIELIIASFCEIYLCLSAFRYSYGVALSSLVVYLDSKKLIKNKIYLIILYLALPFIHTSLILIPIVALFTHSMKKKAFIIELIGIMFVNVIINYFRNSSYTLLQSVATKAEMYNLEYSIQTSFWLSISIYIGIIILIIMCISEQNSLKKDNLYFLNCFIINLFISLIVLLASVPALFFRLYYIIVILSIPIVRNYCIKHNTLSKYIYVFLLIICCVIKLFFQYINYFSNWMFI